MNKLAVAFQSMLSSWVCVDLSGNHPSSSFFNTVQLLRRRQDWSWISEGVRWWSNGISGQWAFKVDEGSGFALNIASSLLSIKDIKKIHVLYA